MNELSLQLIAIRDAIERLFYRHGIKVGVYYFGEESIHKRCVSKQLFTSGESSFVHNPGILQFFKSKLLIEHLLRARSYSLTDFNQPDDEINSMSPFSLRELGELTKSHIDDLPGIVKDSSFTGIWISLHSSPFLLEGSGVVRNKVLCWSLVELLDGDEKQLTAMWVHPSLTASSTFFLLKSFIPYVILEALEASLQDATTANLNPQKGSLFFWLYQLDILPRPCLILLLDDRYIGMHRHIDIGDDYSHADEDYPATTTCPCKGFSTKKSEAKSFFSIKLAVLVEKMNVLQSMIPSECDERLLDDLQALPFDTPIEHRKLSHETKDEIFNAEFANGNTNDILDLLQARFGAEGKNRLKRIK